MTPIVQRGVQMLFAVLALTTAGSAFAGVPECGNLRLEEAKACELKASIDCEASCSKVDVFKKKCATRLTETCRKTECKLKANETCQNPCTESCKTQCDRGADINCQHNCFGECRGACDAQCQDASDPAQCLASCEATCDGECDSKCVGVDGDCYYHCTECCHGACSAEANLDCQEECQQTEFEQCEYGLQADCDASCSGQGSLFCDGEFVLSGAENLARCAESLASRGLLTADVVAKIKIDADLESGASSFDLGGDHDGVGCGVVSRGAPHGGAAGLMLALAATLRRGRLNKPRLQASQTK